MVHGAIIILRLSYASTPLSRWCLGGILIRAIQKVGGSSSSESKKKTKSAAGGELIEGPCNVVNHILTTCGYDPNDGVAPLADHMSLDAFDASTQLHFVAAPNASDAPIVASARYGSASLAICSYLLPRFAQWFVSYIIVLA
jgi:hypothetical protein